MRGGCRRARRCVSGRSLDVFADFGQVSLHRVGILVADDGEQLVELRADALDLCRRAWVEENLLQEVVILAQHAPGDCHVALEGGAGRVLVLHDGCKDEGGHEGDGERVGDGFVVLLEAVFEDVQLQRAVEVLEEDASQVVALGDDDGILVAQVVEAGEGGSEHGMGGDVAEAAGFVELLQSGLHGGDVAEDALLGQQGEHVAEGVERVLHGGGIDDQLGTEVTDFVVGREAVGVVDEAHPSGFDVKDGCFVLEAEEVGKEGAHFSGSEYQYSHVVGCLVVRAPAGGRDAGLRRPCRVSREGVFSCML